MLIGWGSSSLFADVVGLSDLEMVDLVSTTDAAVVVTGGRETAGVPDDSAGAADFSCVA